MRRRPVQSLVPALSLVCALASAASSANAPGEPAPTLREGDIFTDPAEAPWLRGVAYPRHRTWPDGVMPVWLSPDLDRRSREIVRDAIAVWNGVAGVRIDELSEAPDPRVDHVRFEPGDGCASWVGRRGGAQSLWVAPACNRGSVLHELGHALGLEHEHTRSDRDAWILIHWDRIALDKRHNFERAPDGDRHLGPYDYDSIMHYGPDFFGIDGAITIEPLDPSARIGQRVAPSAGDVAALAELYGTDLSLSADLFAEAGDDAREGRRHALEVRVTNQGVNGAHDVRVKTALPTGWRFDGVLATDGDWRCRAGEAIECTRARLAPDAQAALTVSVRAPDMTTDAAAAARRAPTTDTDTDTDTDASAERMPTIVLEVSAGVHDATTHNDTVRLDRIAAEREDLGEPTRDASVALTAFDDGSADRVATSVAWPGESSGGLGAGLGIATLGLLVPLFRRRRSPRPSRC